MSPILRAAMPRAPRLVAPGSTMHVVARGNGEILQIANVEFGIADWRAVTQRHSLRAEPHNLRRSTQRVVGTTAIVARYFPAEWRKLHRPRLQLVASRPVK